MAGIAMLFVAGIISAFMFAKDNALEQNAERAAASSTAAATMTTPGGTASRPAQPIARSEPETTGSRPPHDPREDQQLERDGGGNLTPPRYGRSANVRSLRNR